MTINWLKAIWDGLLCIGSFGALPERRKPMSDEEAMAHDWAMVMGDLRHAIDSVKQEQGATK